MSDKLKVVAYLETHGTITCYQAKERINVQDLRSRASELGLHSVMIPVTRADGIKTRVAEYSLPKLCV